MKAEIQNQLWAILPKEARTEVKVAYGIDTINKHFDNSYNTALIDIFGLHNLTSDTKPEEMLYISRETVIEKYAEIFCNKAPYLDDSPEALSCQACLKVLESLFDNKCLPDKEEEIADKCIEPVKEHFEKECKPKFKAHDIVVFNDNICRITGTDYENKEYQVERISDNNLMGWVNEQVLEPYTEENKEPMEEKELNLCELLAYQDLSGTYSPIYGEVRVTDIACDCLVITPEHSSDNNVELFPDGRFSKNGDCLLFPSRALYEKYPLDAYSAWMEWKAERKPKHTLQAQIRLISNDGKTIEDYECVEVEVPNIDLTQAAEAVRETLMKIHEKKLKKHG